MKEKQLLMISAVLVIAISGAVLARIQTHSVVFAQDAARMEAATATYDKDFIAMVNRLETELAERASFPFLGGKDPMTGKTRFVVAAPKAPEKQSTRKEQSKPKEAKDTVQTSTQAATPAPAPVVEVENIPVSDPVRLTAVIYDDFKKAFTAIMMVDERSYSVEVGEKIKGRVVKSITGQQVILEDNKRSYQYDISGKISNRVK